MPQSTWGVTLRYRLDRVSCPEILLHSTDGDLFFWQKRLTQNRIKNSYKWTSGWGVVGDGVGEYGGKTLTNIKKVIVYRAWGVSCLASCLQFTLLIGSPAFRGYARDSRQYLKYAMFLFHLPTVTRGSSCVTTAGGVVLTSVTPPDLAYQSAVCPASLPLSPLLIRRV